MRADRWVTPALLLGLVVLHILLWVRIGALEERLAAQSTDGPAALLLHEVEALHRRLGEMERAQQWLADVREQVDLEQAPCTGPVPVVLEWTFRELPAGAAVAVRYRPEGGTWREAAATPVGWLTYRAELALDPAQDWEWQVVATGPWGQRGDAIRSLNLAAKLAGNVSLHARRIRSLAGNRSEWEIAVVRRGPIFRPHCDGITAVRLSTRTAEDRPVQELALAAGPDPDQFTARLTAGPDERWARAVVTFADGSTKQIEVPLDPPERTAEVERGPRR